ncbi:GNAT family N-acetyltransferase [Defluviimonas sp. WL0024]|uniref:GNAT family N-acetyltransferase n=1 Tax=Albidovulum salinarum TaxID=2984153 RepID=A0ABT2X7C7_9RHOB|nr:GNAT family N-acetyltransferase [Defluviimonas sp. WL0024]MCU9849857.1 GNAT family N-acetyltransferase [Defluviimonas sp. WL0024]
MTSFQDRITILRVDPEAPEARRCLAAYLYLLSERIEGMPASHVPDPDPEAASYRPPGGAFLIAQRDDGQPVACVALKTLSPGVGEVKRLWVDASARGHGLARRMMRAIEDEARTMGLARLRLDTNESLTEAIALYRSEGWGDITAYTGWPATHWFGKTLT